MPSKLLIAAADAAHAVAHAGTFGIRARRRVDGPAVMGRLRRMRDAFARTVRESIAELPEGTCLRGRARFVAPGVLALDSGERVEARAVVIASGASAALPAAFEAVRDRVLDNTSVFELDDLPTTLGVIGAGPLGLELAQAMHRLGVRVELFDAGDRLAGLPPETSRALYGIVSARFPVHLDCAPEAARHRGGVTLSWPGGSARFERLLVAAGRRPNLDALGLDQAGLELDRRGVPLFDPETMQCGDAPVFIAGDANGDRPLLHEAADEGTVAGHNARSWPETGHMRRKVPLAITFTRPEAATVGRIPDAGDAGHVTGEADFADQGRANVMGRGQGLVRIHARAGDGRLVGASLCAPGGEHLAHLLAWLIQREATATEALELPFYHPTLEEGLQVALRGICRQVEPERPWERDDDPLPGARDGA